MCSESTSEVSFGGNLTLKSALKIPESMKNSTCVFSKVYKQKSFLNMRIGVKNFQVTISKSTTKPLC